MYFLFKDINYIKRRRQAFEIKMSVACVFAWSRLSITKTCGYSFHKRSPWQSLCKILAIMRNEETCPVVFYAARILVCRKQICRPWWNKKLYTLYAVSKEKYKNAAHGLFHYIQTFNKHSYFITAESDIKRRMSRSAFRLRRHQLLPLYLRRLLF